MAFNGTVNWAGTVRAVRMCAAASALPLVTVPAHATEVDDQAWFTLSGAQDFGKAAVQLDLSTRLTDELTRMSQQNARLTATYDLSPKVSVGGGYYYGQSEQPDVPDIVEHRPFEQVNVRIGGLPKGVTLVSRSRLEERFRQGGPGMGLRSYENLRLQIPLGHRITLINQAEVAWNLNDTIWGQHHGFSSLRGTLQVNFPLTRKWSIQPGYAAQYIARYRAEHRFYNAVLLNIQYRG
jgi:hypothetical protein